MTSVVVDCSFCKTEMLGRQKRDVPRAAIHSREYHLFRHGRPNARQGGPEPIRRPSAGTDCRAELEARRVLIPSWRLARRKPRVGRVRGEDANGGGGTAVPREAGEEAGRDELVRAALRRDKRCYQRVRRYFCRQHCVRPCLTLARF